MFWWALQPWVTHMCYSACSWTDRPHFAVAGCRRRRWLACDGHYCVARRNHDDRLYGAVHIDMYCARILRTGQSGGRNTKCECLANSGGLKLAQHGLFYCFINIRGLLIYRVCDTMTKDRRGVGNCTQCWRKSAIGRILVVFGMNIAQERWRSVRWGCNESKKVFFLMIFDS